MDVLIMAYRSGAAGSNVTTIVQLGATLKLSSFLSLKLVFLLFIRDVLELELELEHLRSWAHIAPHTASA